MARSENNLTAVFTDTANAIRSKTGQLGQISPRDFADQIATLHTNAEFDEIEAALDELDTGTGENYTVTVIDYDGTVIDERLCQPGDVYILPGGPIHEGLTFDGWSSSEQIVSNQITVSHQDIMVGAMYYPTSGKLELEVDVPQNIVLTLTGFDSIDWGDGSSSTGSPANHVYSTAAHYWIKATPASGTTSFGNSNISLPTAVQQIRIPKNSITSLSLRSNSGSSSTSWNTFFDVNSIIIPSTVTSVSIESLLEIKTIIIPAGATSANLKWPQTLRNVVLPYGLTSVAVSGTKCANIVVPATVQSLVQDGFYNNRDISTLDLSHTSLQSLSGSYGCVAYAKQLKRVMLPTTIRTIGSSAFNECNSLKTFQFPPNLTSIGSNAFNNCYDLQFSNDIPATVTSIGSNAFTYCESIKSIKIPTGITSLPDSVFSQCQDLRFIDLPNTLTSIAESAFYYCESLETINIPEGVTSIGSNAFNCCFSLESVTLPSTLTTLFGGSNFKSCYALESINLPNGITNIPSMCFNTCLNLTRIQFPSGITTLGSKCCGYCKLCGLFDFSNASVVPTAQSDSFIGLNDGAHIVVPDSLYSTWVGATNWAALAAQIYPVSGYGVYDSTISDGSLSSLVVSDTGSTVISVVPDSGFTYPASVTVTGATASYDSTTGEITLSNPTANLTITAACVAL